MIWGSSGFFVSYNLLKLDVTMQKGKAWGELWLPKWRGRQQLILKQRQEMEETEAGCCKPTLDQPEPGIEKTVPLCAAEYTLSRIWQPPLGWAMWNATKLWFCVVYCLLRDWWWLEHLSRQAFSQSAQLCLLESGSWKAGSTSLKETLEVEEKLALARVCISQPPTNHRV